jgi:hypothetical protein
MLRSEIGSALVRGLVSAMPEVQDNSYLKHAQDAGGLFLLTPSEREKERESRKEKRERFFLFEGIWKRRAAYQQCGRSRAVGCLPGQLLAW